jgi:O-antigen/teichoic acid export membrane protein
MLIAAALWRGHGLLTVGVVHAITRLAEAAILSMLCRRRLPRLRVSVRLAHVETFKSMIGYSVNTMIFAAGDAIFKSAGLLVIGVFLTTSDATYYGAVMTIVFAFSSIAQSIAAVVKPAATALAVEGRTDKVRELSLRGSRYVVLAMLPMATMLCVYGGPFLGAWVAPDFRALGSMLAVLVVVELFNVGQRVSALVVIGLGKHRPFAVATILSALAGVALAVILVRFFGWGLWGVAAGHAISNALIGLGFLPWYISKTLELTPRRHWREIFGGPLLGSLPFFGLAAALRGIYVPGRVLTILAVSACGALGALVGYWFLVFRDDERARVIGWCRRIGGAQR